MRESDGELAGREREVNGSEVKGTELCELNEVSLLKTRADGDDDDDEKLAAPGGAGLAIAVSIEIGPGQPNNRVAISSLAEHWLD
ncbi:hypothetical protein ABZP36_013647 [Zizania latifolia]